MPAAKPEQIHLALLEELYEARKRVERLEKAVTQTSALLGTGIELESETGKPVDAASAPAQSMLDRLELVEPSPDISDYLGIEGNDDTRPSLGPDAPDSIKPNKAPGVSSRVFQVASEAPGDSVVFDFGGHAGSAAGEDSFDSPQSLCKAALVGGSDPLAAILEYISEGIYYWDLRSGEMYFSRRWSQLLGYPAFSPVELGKWYSCLHPTDAQLLKGDVNELLQGARREVRAKVRIARKDKGWNWGLFRAVCLADDSGKPCCLIGAMADITAQKENEFAQHAAEVKFRALAEDSSDLVLQFDRNFNLIYASPAISRFTDVDRGDLIGKSAHALEIEPLRSFLPEYLRQAVENGLSMRAETSIPTLTSGMFTADCRFFPDFADTGEVKSITVQIRDMALVNGLQENYQALFTSMADGFALFSYDPGAAGGNPSGDFVLKAINPALAKMFHLDGKHSAGQSLYALMHEEAGDLIRGLALTVAGNAPHSFSKKTADGRYLDVNTYIPEPGRVACIIKDVTRLHNVEQGLRLNEARFAALYQLSHMDMTSEEDVIQFALEQAVRLTGSDIGYLHLQLPNEPGHGRTFWSRRMLADTDDAGQAKIIPRPSCLPAGGQLPLKAQIFNTAPASGTWRMDGLYPIARHMLAPVIEEGRIVCIAGVANKAEDYESSDLRQLELFISGMWYHLRRRRHMQTMQQSMEKAEAANRAKSEFLANVSHELRTPLNGIMGTMQLLAMSALTDKQKHWVETAASSGKGLLSIISDILDFSRLDSGKVELECKEFDFASTVNSCLGMFAHQAREKNIAFNLSIDPAIPGVLLGDEARLRQVLINLVGNAIKFTASGSVTVECSLLPFAAKNSKRIYIAVKDSGIGMPEDKIDVIFNPFTQLDSSTTRRYAGTGLGLGIVQRIIRLMNASLCVESVLGEGTTIHCSLPFGTKTQPAKFMRRSTDPDKGRVFFDILVAEDEPISQFTLVNMLKKDGHNTICVENGMEALEALRLRRFDLMITDIQMPVLDGLTTALRIRGGEYHNVIPSAKVREAIPFGADPLLNIPADLPIVALTAHSVPGDKERFLAMGLDYFLTKPLMSADLNNALRHVANLIRRKENSGN